MNADEYWIDGSWSGAPNDQGRLSNSWAGETRYHQLSHAPLGSEVVGGRITRTQKSLRPGDVWVEIWKMMEEQQENIAIQEWSEGKIAPAREGRGI